MFIYGVGEVLLGLLFLGWVVHSIIKSVKRGLCQHDWQSSMHPISFEQHYYETCFGCGAKRKRESK